MNSFGSASLRICRVRHHYPTRKVTQRKKQLRFDYKPTQICSFSSSTISDRWDEKKRQKASSNRIILPTTINAIPNTIVLNHRFFDMNKNNETHDGKHQIMNTNRQMSSISQFIPDAIQNWYAAPTFWGGSGFILKTIHNTSNQTIPYYACISLTNVMVRTSLFPLVIKGAKNLTRAGAIAPEIQFWLTMFLRESKEMKNAPASIRKNHFWMNLNTVRGIYRIHKVTPGASLVAPLMQLPFFLYFAVDMRKIITGLDPELANELSQGGALWFENLTDPDPYYVLPILSGVLLYANLEVALGKRVLAGETASKSNVAVYLKDAFQSLSIFIPSFMATSPAGTQIYLLTTFVFTIFQSALLRQDSFRSLVGLPSMNAPKPKSKLADEFMEFMKKDQEATVARGSEEAEIVGKGVLSPGFSASIPTGNKAPSTIVSNTKKSGKSQFAFSGTGDALFSLPKPTMMIQTPKEEGEKDTFSEAKSEEMITMPQIPEEVMIAANEGRPMPRPVVMTEDKDKEQKQLREAKMTGKDIAKSLRKKRKNPKKKR